jgi:hypothetical protein
MAAAIEDDSAAPLDDSLASVPDDDAVRHLEGSLARERGLDGLAHPVPIARMDA